MLTALPLVQDLSHPAMRDRHWMMLMKVGGRRCGTGGWHACTAGRSPLHASWETSAHGAFVLLAGIPPCCVPGLACKGLPLRPCGTNQPCLLPGLLACPYCRPLASTLSWTAASAWATC